jgi:hypothetical protein
MAVRLIAEWFYSVWFIECLGALDDDIREH